MNGTSPFHSWTLTWGPYGHVSAKMEIWSSTCLGDDDRRYRLLVVPASCTRNLGPAWGDTVTRCMNERITIHDHYAFNPRSGNAGMQRTIPRLVSTPSVNRRHSLSGQRVHGLGMLTVDRMRRVCRIVIRVYIRVYAGVAYKVKAGHRAVAKYWWRLHTPTFYYHEIPANSDQPTLRESHARWWPTPHMLHRATGHGPRPGVLRMSPSRVLAALVSWPVHPAPSAREPTCTLNTCSLLSHTIPSDSERKDVNTFIFFRLLACLRLDNQLFLSLASN